MHTGGARYHMRIEINFVDSFDTSIIDLREYKHIILGGEATLYKEITYHELDDMVSNPGRGVMLIPKLGLTQLPIQSML
jgi:hypothetical protein